MSSSESGSDIEEISNKKQMVNNKNIEVCSDDEAESSNYDSESGDDEQQFDDGL